MAKDILEWKVKRFSGLTGTGQSIWDPFDFSSYGVVKPLRCIIDLDCVALATNDSAASYSIQFSSQIVYTWNPSGFAGTIVKENVLINDTGAQISWSRTNGGGAGALRVTATATTTTNTFTVCMAARAVTFVESD